MRIAIFLLLGSSALSAQESSKAPSATVSDKAIEFRAGKTLVTRYHIDPEAAKPYFWPILAPGDIPATRGWPMEKGLPKQSTDHPHQKSAWFCHGDVVPEGLELKTRSLDKRVRGVDFWSETPGHGRIVCTSSKPMPGTANSATVETVNEWRTPDGVKILDEVRTISLVLVEGEPMIVVRSTLKASVYPITFGDTKEGSMGIRVSDQIVVKEGGGYLNAEGKKGEKEVWGQPSKWVDYVGKIDGKAAGIAVFDHPKNAHPAVWHARGYGLVAANPFGRKESGFPSMKDKTDLVKLNKGDELTLTYAIYPHAGDTEAGGVAKAFAAFAERR